MRKTPIVDFRYSAPITRTRSPCAEARPKTFSVVIPTTTSTKWPLSRPSVDHCRSTRFWVYMPMRIMNTGISGTVQATMIAESTSWVRMTMPTDSGTMTANTSCGRYRAK